MTSYSRVKKFRHTFKHVALTVMGGKCQICGYDKCKQALELHHTDPSHKEISFSVIKSWSVLYNELNKAILLCANCHREVHYGHAVIPDSYTKFNEQLADSLRNARSHNSVKNPINRKDRMKAILNSGVDFSQKAWASKLSNVLGISSVNCSKWVKLNMPEFYISSCFKYDSKRVHGGV